MAYLEDYDRTKCGKHVHYSVKPQSGFCWECEEARLKELKRKWMAEKRYQKTLKQRIEWIENWIYENEHLLHDHPTF